MWRLLCANWHLLRGTPVRYWFDSELGEIFGVRERPSADNADALYDQIAEQLAAPDHRPRALLRRFGIDVLATTDDPADDLEAHARLARGSRGQHPGRAHVPPGPLPRAGQRRAGPTR